MLGNGHGDRSLWASMWDTQHPGRGGEPGKKTGKEHWGKRNPAGALLQSHVSRVCPEEVAGNSVKSAGRPRDTLQDGLSDAGASVA